MVTVNNFEVNAKGEVTINVETLRGQKITKLLIWNMYDFLDYSLAIDVSDKLLGINNKEVIIIPAGEIPINTGNELLFMEAISDMEIDCNNTMAVTYDISHFQKCLLDSLFKEYDIDNTNSCDTNNTEQGVTILIDLLIGVVEKSLSLGYYGQAIDVIEKLRVMCKGFNCGCSGSSNTGPSSSCSKFKQF